MNSNRNNGCLDKIILYLEKRTGIISYEALIDSINKILECVMEDIQISPDLLGNYLAQLGLKIEVVKMICGDYNKVQGRQNIRCEREDFGEGALFPNYYLVLVSSQGGLGAGHYYLMDGSEEVHSNAYLTEVYHSNSGSLKSISVLL
jgi:hypothetical protein